MYIWTILAVAVGATIAVFQTLLIFGLIVKAWQRKKNGECEPAKVRTGPSKSVCVTDPFSGKLVNLERVSNASSLRSTKSVGFITYDRPESSHSRGVSSLFNDSMHGSIHGSINSEKLNRSMAASACSSDRELKTINVNPLFKEESFPKTKPHDKKRAREIRM